MAVGGQGIRYAHFQESIVNLWSLSLFLVGTTLY